jgi:hypothetical protein
MWGEAKMEHTRERASEARRRRGAARDGNTRTARFNDEGEGEEAGKGLARRSEDVARRQEASKPAQGR